MRITKLQFWIITLLFLLLPFSVHWKLIVFGEVTRGEVAGYLQGNVFLKRPQQEADFAAVVCFNAQNQNIEFEAPENIHYALGEKLKVLYNPSDPEQHVLFNFAGLFLSNRMIIPGVMLIMWLAFALSLNQAKTTEGKKTFRKGRREQFLTGVQDKIRI
ncbi:MAG: hypothetical protein IPM71_12300 [Bacteroidota bacterium]|nr:MAG: hypothetical protein IPM71_12300 [Bacteroidota bacterium]